MKQLKEIPADPEGCSEFERLMLRDLELAQKYMQRVMGKSQDERLDEPELSCAVPPLDQRDLEPLHGLFSNLAKTP